MNHEAEEELLRRVRPMRRQVTAFQRQVRAFLESLPEMDDADVEEPVTREADIVGALECLLMDDFGPALRKLTELESLLEP